MAAEHEASGKDNGPIGYIFRNRLRCGQFVSSRVDSGYANRATSRISRDSQCVSHDGNEGGHDYRRLASINRLVACKPIGPQRGQGEESVPPIGVWAVGRSVVEPDFVLPYNWARCPIDAAPIIRLSIR